MVSEPLGAVRSASGIHKEDSETLREYVQRVGETEDIDPELIEAAIEYVVRWQYAETAPDDDDAFRRFLQRLDGESVPEAHSDVDAAGTRIDAPDLEPAPETRPLRAERRDMRSDFKSGLRGREPRKLLLRFAGMVLLAPLLGWLLGRAWVPGHTFYDRGQLALASVLGLTPVRAIELVGTFGLGLYLAFIVLFVVDIKKRVQGMLFAIGTVLTLAVLTVMGVFIPNLDTTWLNGVGFVFGVLVGVLVESDQLLQTDWEASSFRRPTLQNGATPEFRRTGQALSVLVSLIIIGSIIQAIEATVIRVPDIVAAGGFLVLSFQFIRYDSETQYMILGPARAGKSMLALGLCLELVSSEGPRPNPNEYLQQGLERVSNLQSGDARWPIPATPPDELNIATFEVIAGYYFPRRLTLTALDYAGQHLERVARLFASGQVGEATDSVPAEVADWVADGDTLLVVLDIERLAYPEKFGSASGTEGQNISWGLEHYASILEHNDQDDIIIVATKCDILIDQQRVTSPTVHDSYDAFRESVTEELRTRPDIAELLELTGESSIHPVYYATKRRNDTEYVPRLDEAGNLMPVGFGHLIAELRRRQ